MVNTGSVIVVLLRLADPDVEQAAVTADLALEQALSAYTSLEASLEAELLSLRSAAAAVESERAQAVLQARVDATLAKADCSLKSPPNSRRCVPMRSPSGARLEHGRVTALEHSQKTRLAAQQSEVRTTGRSPTSSAATWQR